MKTHPLSTLLILCCISSANCLSPVKVIELRHTQGQVRVCVSHAPVCSRDHSRCRDVSSSLSLTNSRLWIQHDVEPARWPIDPHNHRRQQRYTVGCHVAPWPTSSLGLPPLADACTVIRNPTRTRHPLGAKRISLDRHGKCLGQWWYPRTPSYDESYRLSSKRVVPPTQ
jgi:hypothetical protein